MAKASSDVDRPQPTLAHSRRSRLRRAVLAGLIVLAFAPLLLRAEPSENPYPIDSTLLLLTALRARKHAPPELSSLLDSQKLAVTVRFRHPRLMSTSTMTRIEQELGIEFTRVGGEIAAVGRTCGAQVPWDALSRLAEWPGVERIDSAWKPAVAYALDVSIGEIRADDVWQLLDTGGWPVTGRGVVLAVFDSGIDVFHPDFWRTAGAHHWLDVNANQAFDPGVDAVDLNRNGEAESNERLDFIDSGTAPWSGSIPGTSDGTFGATLDWPYNDANRNGRRDSGPAHGFVESDPGYGERIFLVDDSNHNGRLDLNEVLLALDTSKVRKTLDAAGHERTRGLDLITNPPDADEGGHGTQVSSIIAGGTVGRRRYVGVAPGSQLLVAESQDLQGNNLYSTYIPWAKGNGAKVMLYSFGSWVQEFMDGSSNLEQMLDAASAQGIVQVVAAGNLAGSDKHAHMILPASSGSDTHFHVPPAGAISYVSLSVLWKGPQDAVTVQLMTPLGGSVTLPGDDSWTTVDGHGIWSYLERSPRGTSRFDVFVYREAPEIATGNWKLRLQNRTAFWLDTHAYITDNFGQWAAGVTFIDRLDNMYTITSPGTADTAITVGSYATRGNLTGVPGGLSAFSGQGPRLDGQPILDISAPGHYDIASASSKDVASAALGQYAWFGGTSAAAPHVAGSVALLLQKEPSLSPAQVKERLRSSARDDIFTGLVPNPRWGAGKLDIGAALNAPPKPTPTPAGRLFLPIVLKPAAL